MLFDQVANVDAATQILSKMYQTQALVAESLGSGIESRSGHLYPSARHLTILASHRLEVTGLKINTGLQA